MDERNEAITAHERPDLRDSGGAEAATAGYRLRSCSRIAGMAQVEIPALPTLSRVTQETPALTPQARLGRGWVGAPDVVKNRPKAFARKAFQQGLE